MLQFISRDCDGGELAMGWGGMGWVGEAHGKGQNSSGSIVSVILQGWVR
jgi:hypothetical protein